MGIAIVIACFKPRIPINKSLPGHRSRNRTDKCLAHGIWIRWHKVGTRIISPMCLVNKQRLKGISEWIYIGDPFEPRMHIRTRKDKSRISNKCKNEKSRYCHGLRKRNRCSSNGAEDHRHSDSCDEDKKEKNKEL